MDSLNYGIGLTSPPLKVRWAGWESDTYTLAKNGWDISVTQGYSANMFNRNLQVAMRSKAFKLYGISHGMDIDYQRVMTEPHYWQSIVIEMNGIAHDIPVRQQGIVPAALENMRPIDPIPEYAYLTPIMLSQCQIFRTFDIQAREILLSEPTLEQVLDYAINLQEPRQKEIRQDILKRRDMADYHNDNEEQQKTELRARLMLVA